MFRFQMRFKRKLPNYNIIVREKWLLKGYHSSIQRGVVSDFVEPPMFMDHDVPERPCTMLLMEDKGIYGHVSSWRETFGKTIPIRYRMPFGYMSYPARTDATSNGTIGPNKISFEKVVNELKVDIPANYPDAILVARGPLSSWSAQLYLESFPLMGLVLVDPILFDRCLVDGHEGNREMIEMEATKLLMDKLKEQEMQSLEEYHLLKAITNGLEKRVLKLEPNAVPMLVLQTIQDNSIFYDMAVETARRHSDHDGPFGDVKVVALATKRKNCNNGVIDDVMNTISVWIDEYVL